MANTTVYQIAVISVDDSNIEEPMLSFQDTFNPESFKSAMMKCESELAHGGRLIDECKRKLVIEIEFDSENRLSDSVKDVHEALRDQCFKFNYQEPTVVEAFITMPRAGSYKAKVNCIFSDGTQKMVFDYFSDELSFYPSEFIGLTAEKCSELFTKKDVAYLRS